MSQVRQVLERMTPLLKDYARIRSPFWPVESNTPQDWLTYARSYCSAAITLDAAVGVHELPAAQLAGHAIECALKAYLTYRRVPIPTGTKGHDIVSLGLLAEDNGCLISELEAIAIFQTSNLYFEDVGTSERYVGRYPTGRHRHPKSIIGSLHSVNDFVASVAIQVGA